MYHATAIKIMIASPSDVERERQVARDVIHEWNAVHSEDKGLVLMPVGWETHAQPAMGDRAQALINKQVLEGCDLLVAVFWTRIGSPTGTSVSGTVEEIEEHLKAGKPAMLYFSRAPVRPDSVDDVQYKALLEFRRQCESRGLIEFYESIQEFRDKFARQLAQAVIANVSGGTDAEIEAFADLQALRGRDPVLASLSDDARELLVEGAADKNGTIMRLQTMGGLRMHANRKQFGEPGNARSEAKWESALEQLRKEQLLQDVGHKGELFRVTDRGYRVADRIRGG